MFIISVHLLICLITVHNIANADASKATTLKLFSRRVANFRTIRTFIGVSLKSCEKECNHRSRCQGVLYHRRATRCILTSTRPQNLTVADRDMLLVINFNPKGAGTVCGENISASKETSVKNKSRNVCKATECGQLPSLYSKVQGNMYGRGNKLFIQWPVPITLVCGDGGIWETEGAQIANDCTGVFGKSGVYILSPTTRVVYCDMETDEGHWLVFQRRQDGTVDFLRNWQNYVSGFGNITGEFWLGLQPLYEILLTGEFELRIDLEKFSGERAYAKYSTFTVTGPQDNYRLGVSGFTGNAGDSLTNVHNGRRFTTLDHDNDEWDNNCASTYKGAWWYGYCHASNLNGLYFPSGDNTVIYAVYINWKTWTGYYHSLKRTEMKIRRKLNQPLSRYSRPQ